MKSVMMVYNHGLTEEINEALEKLNIRGYTKFLNVLGQGSDKGEPHLGSHIWPSQNVATIVVIKEEQVDTLLNRLKEIDKESEEQGLHAFVWNIEKMI